MIEGQLPRHMTWSAFASNHSVDFRVYLGVRTCELFLCFEPFVFLRSIVLTSLLPLFYAVCDKRRLQTCRPADLQTSRLADSKICRPTFFVTGLWANFIHPLFTVGESQSMSEANNSASGLQTQQCPIRQVTGNPCRGRLNIGRTVT